VQITVDIEFDRLVNMLATAQRQICILRNLRRKLAREGCGVSPPLEEDIRNMDRIVAHLRALRNRTGNPYLEELKR